MGNTFKNDSTHSQYTQEVTEWDLFSYMRQAECFVSMYLKAILTSFYELISTMIKLTLQHTVCKMLGFNRTVAEIGLMARAANT
jgi:hypothetical protein